jgi:hypothetical protein
MPAKGSMAIADDGSCMPTIFKEIGVARMDCLEKLDRPGRSNGFESVQRGAHIISDAFIEGFIRPVPSQARSRLVVIRASRAKAFRIDAKLDPPIVVTLGVRSKSLINSSIAAILFM